MLLYTPNKFAHLFQTEISWSKGNQDRCFRGAKKTFRCLSGFESTSRNKVSDGTEPKAETSTDWLNGQRHLVTAD